MLFREAYGGRILVSLYAVYVSLSQSVRYLVCLSAWLLCQYIDIVVDVFGWSLLLLDRSFSSGASGAGVCVTWWYWEVLEE